MKTRIARDVGAAYRTKRPNPAAGTAGWEKAQANRARVRSALRAPSDWKALQATPALQAMVEPGADVAPVATPGDIVRPGGQPLDPAIRAARDRQGNFAMTNSAPLHSTVSQPLQAAGAGLVLQRKCACGGGASGLTGECAECSRKKMVGLQTKLRVNEPADAYEQEADRVAEQVLAQPAHPDVSSAAPRIQRYAGQSSGQMAAAPASVDRALASPGRPLEAALRQDMEQRFGQDFSKVRVHSGAAAGQSAQDVNAQAYTVGQDIVFGAGRFAPTAREGRRLIAHELAHVVQQSGIQGNRMGERAGRRGLPHLSPTSDVRLQRGPPDPESLTGQILILGRSDATPKNDDVVLYHYGDLEARRERDVKTVAGAPFKSTPGYPRLTDCGTATCQVEVTQHTGTPENVKLRYKYEVRIDRAYFDKHFRDTGTRGAYSEYVSREPIPMQYFRRVAEIAPTSSAPPRLPPVSGDIIVKTPPPGSTSTSGAGGGQSPPTRSVEVTAETGAPLDPVIEATPGFEPGKGAGLGGAVQYLQAKQFGNLQQDEIAKYEKRLAQLQPKIEAYLRSGYSVQLILVVEKPNTLDFGCAVGVFCDQSQFIYFHDLFINYVESVKPVTSLSPPATTSGSSMSSPGGRDGFYPLVHQGGSKDILYDEKELLSLPTRDPNHHCEYAKQTLYPQESISPLVPSVEASRRPAQPAKPKPKLDPATKKALAQAPSRVYVLSGNINQYKTAVEIQKKITGNPSFVVAKEDMVGVYRKRTIVSYWSDLDKPRAEALAEIIRSAGVASAYAELSGDGDDAPGVLQIFFGIDAEK